MLPAFGPGALFVQRTDITSPPQTPVNIGKANEFSVDFAYSKKELYGENNYPLLVSRGTAKVTAKAKAALISGLAFNAVMFGQTLATGENVMAKSESHTVSTSADTVSVTPPGSGTYIADIGVVYTVGGLPLVESSSTAPSAGDYYETSTGGYVFNASDAGKGVLVTYLYNLAATGQNLAISQQAIGTTPTFKAWYYTAVSQAGGAVPLTVQLNECVADKLSMQFKLEDFMMPEFDFSVFADGNGNVGQLNLGEVS